MKTQSNLKKLLLAGIVSSAALLSANTQASVFSVSGSLTGDPRFPLLGSLAIDVTIDVNGTVASWLVDINTPSYSTAKLDEFYFNLANITAGDVTFNGFTPLDWEVDSPATVAGGGNNSGFLFEALDPSGPPNAADVTNSQNLLFTATLNRDWTSNDFLSAALFTSNDQALVPGQLGAHLQALGDGPTNSAFLLGNYTIDCDPQDPDCGGGGQNIPEPNIIALLGISLMSLGLSALRRNRKAL